MNLYNKPPPSDYVLRYCKPSPQEYLAHHGILGQRWGKRNGPPYPLGANDHSASERKAGWRKSLDKTSGESDNKEKAQGANSEKKGLTSRQKKAIAVGVAAAAVALAVIGGYQLKKSGKLDPLIERGKTLTKTILGKAGDKPLAEFGSIAGFNLKKEALSRLEDLERVNPWFGRKPGFDLNCTHCVVANELRRRGFDVEATESFVEKPFDVFGKYFKMFIPDHQSTTRKDGESYSDFRQRAIRELCKELVSFGDGARGVIGGYDIQYRHGHVFSWEVINGAVHFSDGQQNISDAMVYLTRAMHPGRYEYARLDDLELKPEHLMDVVRNRT